MTVLTSSVTLVNLDPTNVPNGRQLEGGSGIQLSDEGPGGALIISADDFLLSLQNISTNGFLARSNTNIAVSRTLTSDGTIQITNPTGAAGNPQLSIANNTSIQKVISAAYGTDRATQGRLNFIGAGGVGVTVASNGTLNSADITISGSGGAPQAANYLITIPYVGLTGAFAMSSLATGILKNTTGTGIPTIAVAGTDYMTPNATLTAIGNLSGALGSIIVGTGSSFTSRSIGASGTVPISNGSDWAWGSAAFTNPMTTAGDLISGGVGGAPNRVAVGTNGQVLGVVGGVPAWTSDTGFTNPMTTSQDMILGGVSGVPGRLPLGAANAILSVESTGTSVVWSTTGFLQGSTLTVTGAMSGTNLVLSDGSAPAAPLTGVKLYSSSGALRAINNAADLLLMTNPMTTAGDLTVGGASGAPTRLAVGSNGQVLGVSGGVPAWTSDTGFTNPMTTAGDIIIATTAGAPIRLAAGSNAQALTISGGTPAWTTLADIPSAAAKYIVQTADASIPNAQDLSALPTGLMKSTAITGVISIASGGTDYVVPSANLTALAGLANTTGSLLVMNGTTLVNLGVGSNGQVLGVSGGVPTWTSDTGLTNPMTTQGDLIVGGASGVPARLAKGTANQVLSMDGTGTNEVWATPLSATMTSLSIPFDTTLPGGQLPGGQILFDTNKNWFTLTAGVWTVNIYGVLGMNSSNVAPFVTFNLAQSGVGTLYSFSTPLAPGTNASGAYYGSITFYTAGGLFGVTQAVPYGAPYANSWSLNVSAYNLSNGQNNSNNGLPYS